MKKLRNLVGLIAVLGMAAFMTGCGDDDNGDNNNDVTPPGPQFAPATPAGFTGQTYTVTTTTNGTQTLTFPSDTTYSFAGQGTNPETGTIANLHREGEDWVGTITPDNDQGNLKAGEMRVHFTGANAGTFTAPAADGTVITGTFTSSGPGGGGSTDGGTDGTTGNPNDLSNKTLQLTYSAGGERFTFNSPTAGTYENGNTIAYTYDSTSGHLVIDGGPTATSHYDMTLAPGTTTTTVQYSENGQVQSNDQASFTLQ